MAVAYSLMSLYERMIAAVENAATDANAGMVYYKSVLACFRVDGQRVLFDAYLYLKDWKWRPGKTTERVSIVLRAQEEMTKNGSELVRSTVGVSYYSVAEGSATLLHTMHFDFGPPSMCHPTFHAQLSNQPVLPPVEESRELNCELQLANNNVRCFGNARIPTCDMTLSSVLLCLVADHIGDEFFRDLRPNE